MRFRKCPIDPTQHQAYREHGWVLVIGIGWNEMDSPEQIKALTKELEHGQTGGLKENFHGKFEEERIATLNLIRTQNQENRKEHPNTPELEIVTSSSPGMDHEAIRLSHGGMKEGFFGSPQIYSSDLGLTSLKRSGDEEVPANRSNIDVAALTERLEHGDGVGTEKLLAPLFQEERIRVFQELEKLNEQRRAEHKTEVSLYPRITSSKTGSDSITVERQLSGAHDAFFGGHWVYSDTLDLHTLKRTVMETQDNRK